MSDVNAEGATTAPQDATNPPESATQAPAGDAGNAAGGVSGAEQSQGATSALDASGSNGGSEQIVDAGGEAPPVIVLPAAAAANGSAGASLLAKVEALSLAAFNSGRTQEHNLMAWLHSHLTGAQKIVQGSDELELSDDARAVVAQVKALL